MTRSCELVTDGKTLLFRQPRRPTPPIGTQLPQGAPAAYARSLLGEKTLAWCAANLKGFAWPRVTRLAERQSAKGGM